jgi:DNA topoisomerase-3
VDSFFTFVSAILRAGRHVIHAATHPVNLDERQVNAVSARIELDLRIGAAFTRLQTLSLRSVAPELNESMISYGE